MIHAQDSIIESMDGLNILENDGNLSVVYLVRCSTIFRDKMSFVNNSASFMVIDSNVTFCGSTTFKFGNPVSAEKWAQNEGGAISSFQSTLNFYGNTRFKENHSRKSGGAIYAIESIVNFYACVFIDNNTAEESGGGVYLYRSILFCQGETFITGNEVINSIDDIGGGVHAISSSILTTEDKVDESESFAFDRNRSLFEITENVTTSKLIFMSNHGGLGGGIGLEGYSKIYILSHSTEIKFTYNWSQKGGAIFVNDNATESVCASEWFSTQSIKSECFIQKLHYNSDGYTRITYDSTQAYISFDSNTANITGSILYGGLLDRCTVSQLSDIYYDQYVEMGTITKLINGTKYFELLSNMSFSKGEITSEPVRICFCSPDLEYNCSYLPSTYNVRKDNNLM